MKSLRPVAIENWDSLNYENQQSFADMANFFCKMHLLPNIDIECDKTLKLFQDLALQTKESQFALKTKESVAARPVKTSVKAVHPHGSDQAGVASDFISFLKGKGKTLSMVTFRGNRFNILFYDAGALYEYWDDLSEGGLILTGFYQL